MSTDQEARRVANGRPGQGEPQGPDYIARSVAAKADWLQRVLSPWARRWLGPRQAFPQFPQAALTVGNTQRLLGRVQRLVERGTVWQPEAVSLQPTMVDNFAGAIVNRFPALGAKYELHPAETGPTQTADLVLAGVGEPAPQTRPGDRSFQPFSSLAEFRRAVEAKQRASEAGPAPAGQPAQPQVQRAPAEPPKTRRLARTLPPGSRPVSRVEEVLPGPEAPPAVETLQAEAAPVEPEPEAVPPRPGPPPAVQRRVAEAAPTLAPPPQTEEASPAAGPKMPLVQRQPEPGVAFALEEEAAPARPAAGVELPRPSAGREVTPPVVQRQPAEAAPSPAQPPQIAPIEGASPAPARLEMPVVQRQPESGPPPALAGELPAAEGGPPGSLPVPEAPPVQRWVAEEAPAQPPAVQRQGAEAAPLPAQLPREKAAPPVAEAGRPGPAPLATPHVQREVAEAPARMPTHTGPEPPAPPPVGLDMPLAQRRPVETPPTRQEEAPPAEPEMPLVQRQGAEIESPAAPGIEVAPPARLERSPGQPAVTTPAPAQQPGQPAAPPAVEVGPPAPPGIEKTAPAQPEMPVAQRQATQAVPIPAQPPRREETPPAGLEMPLVQRQGAESEPPPVQRQPAGTPPAPAPLSRQEGAPAAEAQPPSPPVGGETPPARPELPLVQRLAREEVPPAAAGPARVQRVSAPGEPAAGLAGEVMARAASRASLPLIEPLPPTPAGVVRTQPVERTPILPQARAQARPEGSPEPPAPVSPRPGTPPEAERAPAGESPAYSGWLKAAADELPLPPVLQRSATPGRSVSTALIQRQPEAPAPSPVVTPRPELRYERIVQRVEGEGEPPPVVNPPPQPPAEESAPANLDALARQIYPLIKRMLAVERERKRGR